MLDPDDLTPTEAKQRLIKLAVRPPIFKFGAGYYNAESVVSVCAHGTTGINTFGVYIRYRDAEKSTHTFHTVEERDTFIEKFGNYILD
jgi:hypothetical protein